MYDELYMLFSFSLFFKVFISLEMAPFIGEKFRTYPHKFYNQDQQLVVLGVICVSSFTSNHLITKDYNKYSLD